MMNDVQRFLHTQPCLQELDGYLWGLRWQVDNPEKIHGTPTPIDADVLAPLAEYRQKLMDGRVVPASSLLERSHIYKAGKRPVEKRSLPAPTQPSRPAKGKVLDLNRKRKSS